MRKAYENGDFKESRHNMTILEPRTDGISKTQQYKMAGNSIVVNVLYFIFKNLFKQ